MNELLPFWLSLQLTHTHTHTHTHMHKEWNELEEKKKGDVVTILNSIKIIWQARATGLSEPL